MNNHLTWTQLVQIFQDCKPSQFKPPDWAKVDETFSQVLSVQNDEKLHQKLLLLRHKFQKLQKENQDKLGSQRSQEDNTAVLKKEDLTTNPAKK